MKIDCISDLHGYFPKLEGGDLLIIAGDLTARDTEDEYYEFNSWLCDQEYDKKIVVAGNHDTLLEKDALEYLEGFPCFDYLQDSGTEFKGLKIWGSPWSPYFSAVNPHCTAFMLPDEALFDKWQMIPEDTDILITHTPAYGTLDYRELSDGTRYHMGSKTLEAWIKKCGNDSPEMIVFGHIHERGCEYVKEKGILYINGSIVNDRYRHTNNGRTIQFDKKMQKMQRFKTLG